MVAMGDRDPIWNFITFQIWFVFVAAGVIVTAATGSFIPASIAPWIGLLIGVAVNEAMDEYVNAGVRVV